MNVNINIFIYLVNLFFLFTFVFVQRLNQRRRTCYGGTWRIACFHLRTLINYLQRRESPCSWGSPYRISLRLCKNKSTSFATNFLILQLIDARRKRGQRNHERQRFELSYYIYYFFILDSLPHDKNGSLSWYELPRNVKA